MPAAPSLRRRSPRVFAASCLVVSGLLLGGVVGCESESEKADKSVMQSMRAAQGKHGEAAIADLQKAAQDANATPGVSAQAKALLAQAQFEQAQGILSQVHQNELAIARITGEITSIASQIQQNNAVVAGFKELAPKTTAEISKLLETQRTAVEGGGDDAVWKLDKGELPALSAAKARAAKLEPEIKALEDKKADLVKQRADADAKASDLLRQSKRKTGKDSVALFTQSAEETKKAAELGTEVSKVDHELAKLNQDAALAKAQAENLEAAVKGFADQLGQNEKSQQTLEALIKEHQVVSNALVYGEGESSDMPTPSGGDTAEPTAPVESADKAEPAAFQEPAADAAPAPAEGAAPAEEYPAPSEAEAPAAPAKPAVVASSVKSTIVTNATMSSKSRELAALVADTTTKRDAALALLDASLGSYDKAIADANKVRSALTQDMQNPDLGSTPQQAAWKTMSSLYSPLKLALEKATVQQAVASVKRDVIASLASRKAMLSVAIPALEEAGIAVPGGLDDPKLEAELQNARTAADEAYAAVETTLKDQVVDASGNAEGEDTAKGSAQVMRVIARYGQEQLARAVGDTGTADKHRAEALAIVRSGENLEADAYPAYLRTALGIVKAAPSTAPASQPAATDGEGEAPASAPADGETPAPAGETATPPATEPAPAPAAE